MTRVPVRPEMIRWAIERSRIGYGVLSARFPKLDAWQSGELNPTLKQLETFAIATFAPVGFFFLTEPPIEQLPIPDFRTVGNARLARPSPDLLDTIYICQQRQEWYREFARASSEPALSFVGSSRPTDDVVTTAAQIRSALQFSVEERRRLPTWTEALRRFIETADTLGVLVMVSGVVGSNNRRKLNPQEFRGFALADSLAPLVFINGADTKAAQMFTLAHELVHLWLGASALSDASGAAFPSQAVERWCNQVAAELLVPLSALQAEYRPGADLQVEKTRLARHFKVSTLVILRRIHDAGVLTQERFWQEYAQELEHLRNVSSSGGGDFYLTTAARVSKRFARAIVSATWEGRSSFTEASHLLGFRKMSTFKELGVSLGMGATAQ